jgi:hypothetical protein
MKEVAESEAEFRKLASTKEKREEWFAESDELAASRQGLKPGANQCIGFKTPLVFAESGTPNSAYVADLYEYTSLSLENCIGRSRKCLTVRRCG